MFEQLQKIDAEIKLSKLYLVGAVFIAVVSLGISAYLSYFFYTQSKKNMLAVDISSGKTSKVVSISQRKAREIELHWFLIEDFCSTFLTYSKTNYQEQVRKGLRLGGDNLRKQHEYLVKSGWYADIVQQNIIQSVSIPPQNVQIDITTKPYEFYMKGWMLLDRAGKVERRDLEIIGRVSDVPRDKQHNGRGFHIDDIIINSTKVKK